MYVMQDKLKHWYLCTALMFQLFRTVSKGYCAVLAVIYIYLHHSRFQTVNVMVYNNTREWVLKYFKERIYCGKSRSDYYGIKV